MTEFEQIYHTYFVDVFRYTRRLSNDEHIAEEITADTFFKAIQSVDSFRGDCDIRVWLCQIAKNSYLSYLKKHKRTQHIEDLALGALSDPSETVEEQFVRRDEAARIRKILHEIPEPYKEKWNKLQRTKAPSDEGAGFLSSKKTGGENQLQNGLSLIRGSLWYVYPTVQNNKLPETAASFPVPRKYGTPSASTALCCRCHKAPHPRYS